MGNPLDNLTVVPCLKIMLFLFNISFWLSGFLLALVSIWAGLDMFQYVDLPVEFIETAPHVTFGMALLVLIVTTISFSWIIKGQPGLLYGYGGFLACIFVMDAGVAAAIVCYKESFAKGLYDGLIKNIATYNIHKGDLDFAQASLRCCGVANYTDWVKISPQRVIPNSCCINPASCITANYSDVFQQGCYDVITKYFEANLDILVGLALAAAIYPLLGTFISCCLARYIQKTNYDVIA
ncbi:hypothetical protein K1T71_002697 [Dendrolimus kikuchii]|uniref:Uncharacterized protein n=1 Tax=Dendrolimus kikuchii TaxID=765133 RepID=A0ACC1DDU5_9NEOP|nr:hypothetical protein K1T71_002697 [Dendrolimus kikuchii]